MRQLFKKATEGTDPLERVKEWTRERFKLAGDVPVLVAEIACGLPGCPPLETVVVFWTEGDRRHQGGMHVRGLHHAAGQQQPPRR